MAPVVQPASAGLTLSCLARNFSITHSLNEYKAPNVANAFPYDTLLSLMFKAISLRTVLVDFIESFIGPSSP